MVTVSVKFEAAFTVAGALTESTPKSEAGVAVMLLVTLLLPGVGSATLCVTLALLVAVPSVDALICMVTLVLAPPDRVPMLQLIGAVVQLPLLVMETSVALGSVSLKTTLLAAPEPRLVMAKVSVAFCPCSAVAGAETVSDRSALGATAVMRSFSGAPAM